MIEDFIGVRGAQAIQAIIESAGQRPDSGFFASVIAIIFLFLGAGGVVGQLQESLNTIWRVMPRTGRGVRGFLQDRLISYLMVLSVGFLLLVSLIISAALAVISGILGGFLTIDAATAYALDLLSRLRSTHCCSPRYINSCLTCALNGGMSGWELP